MQVALSMEEPDLEIVDAVKLLVDMGKTVEKKNRALKIFADLYSGPAIPGDPTEMTVTGGDIYEAQKALSA